MRKDMRILLRLSRRIRPAQEADVRSFEASETVECVIHVKTLMDAVLDGIAEHVTAQVDRSNPCRWRMIDLTRNQMEQLLQCVESRWVLAY